MSNGVNNDRRMFFVGLTAGVGALGAAVAAVPFVMSWTPSARARAAGAPITVDISKVEPGGMAIVEWRGKPVWIVRRSPEMLASLQQVTDELRDLNSEEPQQPEYARNATRSLKPEVLVLLGVCTHLGCSPKLQKEATVELKHGGFYCPCHGSKFDFAGRVYKGVPAPTNLEVPPHTFLSDTTVLIGQDKKEA